MNAIIRLNLIDGDTVFLNLADKHVWVGEGWLSIGNDYEESQTFTVITTDGKTDKDILANVVSEAYAGQLVILNQRECDEDESDEDESDEDESDEDESDEDESDEDESEDDESEDELNGEEGGC